MHYWIPSLLHPALYLRLNAFFSTQCSPGLGVGSTAHLLLEACDVAHEVGLQDEVRMCLGQPDHIHSAAVPWGPLELQLTTSTGPRQGGCGLCCQA